MPFSADGAGLVHRQHGTPLAQQVQTATGSHPPWAGRGGQGQTGEMTAIDAVDRGRVPPVLGELLPLGPAVGYRVDRRLAVAAERVWSRGRRKLHALVTQHPAQFPLYTTDGRWDFEGEAWTNWCEGFLGGQLWL